MADEEVSEVTQEEPSSPPFRIASGWKNDSDALESRIAEILLSENLIVLTGLGSSMCVKNSDGSSRAPTMWNLWEKVVKPYPQIENVLKAVAYAPTDGKENIETFLSHCQLFFQLHKDDSINNFVVYAEKEILSLCSFIQSDTDLSTHRLFLLKAARRSTRQPRMRLFTTNYDRCFEEAANRAGFIVVDGFTHTYPQEFDGAQFGYDFVKRDIDKDVPDYIPNVFHLYKLHGSVDWERGESPTDRKVIKRVNPDRPAMVFPRQGKFELSYRQPYFEMMSRLQAALRLPNTGLLIVGFGFNDDHITEPIRVALDSNVGLKCCVVSPSWEDDTRSETLNYILSLIDNGDKRISAVNSTFESFVSVIPDLVSRTEQEDHTERIKRASGR